MRRSRRSSTIRALMRCAAAAVLVLSMTSCLKLDMRLNLSSDDTADGSVTFAIDKELLQLTGRSFDDLAGDQTPLPSGVDVSTSDYQDDRFVGKTYTFHDVPLDRFNDSGNGDSLTITRRGDTYVVSGALDLTSAALESGQSGQIAQNALRTAEVRIAIAFPGAVQSASGQIDGNTVTWTPKVGERTEISAVGSAVSSASGTTWLWVVLALLAAVAVIGAAVVLTRRRSEPALAEVGPSLPIGPETAPGGSVPPTTSEAPPAGLVPPTPPDQPSP